MTIDPATGAINWPAPTAGVSQAITVTAAVGGVTISAAPFTINSLSVTSTPVTVASIGIAYSYQVTTTGASLTFSLDSALANMTINSATGLVSWPSPTAGSNTVTVRVTTAGGYYVTQTYTLTAYTPPAAPTGLVSNPSSFDTGCGPNITVTLSWDLLAGLEYAVVTNGTQQPWQTGNSFNYYTAGSQSWYVIARDAITKAVSLPSAAANFTDVQTCDPPPSSCPLVFSWNGTNFGYESDLFGPMIYQTKKGPGNIPLFHPSYITLDELVPDDNNKYRVNIWESLNEATLMDEVKLMAVDYPVGYEITSSDVESTYYFGYVTPFRIITIKDPVSPVTATNKYGVDVLASVLEVDDNTAPMNPTDTDNYYTFDFGTIQHPEYAKLLIDSWLIINPQLYTSTASIQPYLEVVDANGSWVKAKSFGLPSGDLKRMVIDISNIFLTSDHRIRLHLGNRKSHKWVIDKIQLDDSAPVNVTVQELPVVSANLQFGGQIIQAMNTQLHRLQVSDHVLPTRTDYFGYGNFTRYGEVGELLSQRDDKYAIMNYADKMDLTFDGLPAPQSGMTRGFILKADYYFKELKGYPYLDPLPFHGMSDYPPPAPEAYPTDDDHNQYRLLYNTRVFAP
jgi:hypothetical protein